MHTYRNIGNHPILFLKLEVNISLINALSDALDFLCVKLVGCEFPDSKKGV